MDKAAAWSHTKGMRFSSTKTEAIIFSRLKYKKPKSILLNGTPLEYTKLVKYLGVYIDSKLYWNDHVDIKIKKAKKAMMACVRVCHPKSGVPPLCASYYWKSCILPMFTYGCLVWHSACPKITIQRKLKSFQRLALKMQSAHWMIVLGLTSTSNSSELILEVSEHYFSSALNKTSIR